MTTIEALGPICDERCAVNLGWFEVLGAWAVDETDPALQRWFAVGSHRHAWHAELWAARRPAVPHDTDRRLPAPHPVAVAGARADAYAAFLEREVDVVASLRARSDPVLDPATHRLADLVEADLADLRTRVSR